MKDTRAYGFIGNRDAAQYCDDCQQELVGYERFQCASCEPEAHEWEWEDRAGEVWEDPDRGVLLILGAYEPDPRCLGCLVLDGVPQPVYVSWPAWEPGEIIAYGRQQFALGRVDGTKMKRIM